MKKIFLLTLIAFIGVNSSFSQVLSNKQNQYTEADSLRGTLSAERAYDVLKYHLQVQIDPEERFISGFNTITFKAEAVLPIMQIDLFENMRIDSIMHGNDKLGYNRKFNAVFVELKESLKPETTDSIQVFYSGNPIVAKNAPWDGGFVFKKDEEGNPWIAVAVQGTGASLWYPNKDHQSDEPEEALIEIAVPSGLTNVSNGRLIGKTELQNGYTRWSYKVNNPINNYDIVFNIANYVHFQDSYKDLDLDFFVLPYNLEKAKKQFAEVKPMMECFYEKFGEYPFKEDGYKLVETPYLGMEHQSAVAYGNYYKMGYLGRDLSGTGIGLRWDFIIIHESGHEWFGNSITANDIADMWIHEGFTTYSEAVYIECRWGKEDALKYLEGLRKNISNQAPIIGDYGVNSEGSGDMYPKGANLLNTIRSIYDNDELWWKTLKDYTLTFKHQTIDTKTVEDFFNAATATDLQPIFDQYLRYSAIPVLELKETGERISYRWKTDITNFKMPVDVIINNKEIRLTPSNTWTEFSKGVKDLNDIKIIEKEFYIETELVK
ncbi:peptidase M1-like protein [Gillisia mitskevichiae]|uniref:Peptidase M1-like protein n=1 Tax=Gillisia mitskevichiae TaxID=270921 RepID=A0A495PXQ4_9FLAO|nr:M1 family metallopeptidase [Gillisia mitskevichiae]RKS53589.1 peptidase M1-like protein [Gillisia mitskevichiae]